jgi:hypothetical protein
LPARTLRPLPVASQPRLHHGVRAGEPAVDVGVQRGFVLQRVASSSWPFQFHFSRRSGRAGGRGARPSINSRRRLRARDSRDITVPTGTPVMRATSS